MLRPLATGEKLAAERFDQLLDQISEVNHQVAAKALTAVFLKFPYFRHYIRSLSFGFNTFVEFRSQFLDNALSSHFDPIQHLPCG